MIGVVMSVMTMVTGVLIAMALGDHELAAFGWLLAGVGLLSLVANMYVARRMR